MGTSGPFPGATREDLREFVKSRKLGIEKLGRAWCLSPAAVSQRLAGKTAVTIEQLEIALAELGLDPVEFHRGVATRFHPELELHAFVKPCRRTVDRFHKRILRRSPSRQRSSTELAEMVEDLETLRFRNAKAARRQAVEILRSRDLEADVAGEAWGVLGVLYRHRGHMAIAAFCLLQGFYLGASPAIRARTLQRLAMLLFFNAGKPDQALKAIRRAREIYLLAEDYAGVGKTFVDEAAVQSNCGEHQLARQADQQALHYLSEEDCENRFAAFLGLAVSAVFLSDVDEAAVYLGKASATLASDEQSDFLLSFARWLQGELSLLLNHYGQAAEHFVAVWDAYLDLDAGPLEMTLISLRIAKTYLLQGDRLGCLHILEGLVATEKELRRANPLVAPVLSELLRESAEGSVTAELLEQVYLKMREGTPNVPPLLPSTLAS